MLGSLDLLRQYQKHLLLELFYTCDVAWHVRHVAVPRRQSNAASYWLTVEINMRGGRGKMINVWQFQKTNWSFSKVGEFLTKITNSKSFAYSLKKIKIGSHAPYETHKGQAREMAPLNTCTNTFSWIVRACVWCQAWSHWRKHSNH